MNKYAVVYSKENCPYCSKAKILLNNMGIVYDEFIIGDSSSGKVLLDNQHWTTREELLEVAPNARTVPQIWLDGDHIGGYTELAKYFEPIAA